MSKKFSINKNIIVTLFFSIVCSSAFGMNQSSNSSSSSSTSCSTNIDSSSVWSMLEQLPTSKQDVWTMLEQLPTSKQNVWTMLEQLPGCNTDTIQQQNNHEVTIEKKQPVSSMRSKNQPMPAESTALHTQLNIKRGKKRKCPIPLKAQKNKYPTVLNITSDSDSASKRQKTNLTDVTVTVEHNGKDNKITTPQNTSSDSTVITELTKLLNEATAHSLEYNALKEAIANITQESQAQHNKVDGCKNSNCNLIKHVAQLVDNQWLKNDKSIDHSLRMIKNNWGGCSNILSHKLDNKNIPTILDELFIKQLRAYKTVKTRLNNSAKKIRNDNEEDVINNKIKQLEARFTIVNNILLNLKQVDPSLQLPATTNSETTTAVPTPAVTHNNVEQKNQKNYGGNKKDTKRNTTPTFDLLLQAIKDDSKIQYGHDDDSQSEDDSENQDYLDDEDSQDDDYQEKSNSQAKQAKVVKKLQKPVSRIPAQPESQITKTQSKKPVRKYNKRKKADSSDAKKPAKKDIIIDGIGVNIPLPPAVIAPNTTSHNSTSTTTSTSTTSQPSMQARQQPNIDIALLSAIQTGTIEDLTMLLKQQGHNIYGQDSNGYTLLHHAIINAKPEMVEILISPVNIMSNHSCTPLSLACYYVRASSNSPALMEINKKIIQMLVIAGAYTNNNADQKLILDLGITTTVQPQNNNSPAIASLITTDSNQPVNTGANIPLPPAVIAPNTTSHNSTSTTTSTSSSSSSSHILTETADKNEPAASKPTDNTIVNEEVKIDDHSTQLNDKKDTKSSADNKNETTSPSSLSLPSVAAPTTSTTSTFDVKPELIKAHENNPVEHAILSLLANKTKMKAAGRYKPLYEDAAKHGIDSSSNYLKILADHIDPSTRKTILYYIIKGILKYLEAHPEAKSPFGDCNKKECTLIKHIINLQAPSSTKMDPLSGTNRTPASESLKLIIENYAGCGGISAHTMHGQNIPAILQELHRARRANLWKVQTKFRNLIKQSADKKLPQEEPGTNKPGRKKLDPQTAIAGQEKRIEGLRDELTIFDQILAKMGLAKLAKKKSAKSTSTNNNNNTNIPTSSSTNFESWRNASPFDTILEATEHNSEKKGTSSSSSSSSSANTYAPHQNSCGEPLCALIESITKLQASYNTHPKTSARYLVYTLSENLSKCPKPFTHRINEQEVLTIFKTMYAQRKTHHEQALYILSIQSTNQECTKNLKEQAQRQVENLKNELFLLEEVIDALEEN